MSDFSIGEKVIINMKNNGSYSRSTWFEGVITSVGHTESESSSPLVRVMYRTPNRLFRRYREDWLSASQVIGKDGPTADIRELERMMK